MFSFIIWQKLNIFRATIFFSFFSQPEKENIFLINHFGSKSGYPPAPKNVVISSPLHRRCERVHRELLMDGWLVSGECDCQMLMILQKKGPGEEVKQQNVGVQQLPSDVS